MESSRHTGVTSAKTVPLTHLRSSVLAILAKKQNMYAIYPQSQWKSVLNTLRWLVRAELVNRTESKEWEVTELGIASLDALGPWR